MVFAWMQRVDYSFFLLDLRHLSRPVRRTFPCKWLVVLATFSLLVCYLPLGLAAQEYEFEDLGPGAAIDINNRGDVLVVPVYRARFSDSGTTHGWAKVVDASGSPREIRPPAGYAYIVANALNAKGQVAGHVYNIGDYDHKATIWDAIGLATVLPGAGTSAVDINDAGTSAIIKWNDRNSVWSPYWFFHVDGSQAIRDTIGPRVNQLVMKDDGTQGLAGVAIGDLKTGERAIAWSGSTDPLSYRLMQEPFNSISPSKLTSVNDEGVVVGYSVKPYAAVKIDRALIWREAREPEYLFPNVLSAAYDINDNNLVVGEFEIQAKNHAFLMLPDRSWVDLNDVLPVTIKNSGWVLQSAQSINKNGQVVGRALRNQEERAYRLTPKRALPSANLSLAVAIPGPHRVNTNTQFDFTVSNLGAVPTDATVVFRTGQNSPLAWLNTAPNCEVANFTELRCRFDNLGVGETRTLTMFAKCLMFGKFDWRAEVAAVAVDNDISNNTLTGSLEIVRAQSDVAPIYKLRDLGRVDVNNNVNDEAFVRINYHGDIVISEPVGSASKSRLIRGINTVRDWPVGQSVKFLSEQGQIGWDAAGAINIWGDTRFSSPDKLGESAAQGRGIDGDGNLWGTVADQTGRQKVMVRALNQTLTEIPRPANISWMKVSSVNASGMAAGYGRVDTGGNVPLAMRVGSESWRLETGKWSGGEALATSTDGKASGFVLDTSGTARAAWWPGPTELVDLGILVGSNSKATGVNRSGAVVGIAALNTNQQYAFLTRDGLNYDLTHTFYPIPGETWRLTAATGINDDGEIVGIGTRNGKRHAFALYPAVNVQVVGAAVGGPLQASTNTGTFGSHLTVDGDMLAVGVPDDDFNAIADVGAVYRYRHVGNRWVKEGDLARSPTPTSKEGFGGFLQMSGNVLVIGARKSAFISRDSGLPAELVLPGNQSDTLIYQVNANGEQTFVATGSAGSLKFSSDDPKSVLLPSGSGIIADSAFTQSKPSKLVVATRVDPKLGFGPISSPAPKSRTHLWVYSTSPLGDTPEKVADFDSLWRTVVHASASRVALGIPEFKQVHVYHRGDAGWVSEDLLSPPDAVEGSFGVAFALTDDYLLVGDPDGSYKSRASGVVYVYQRHGHAWILETRIGPENGPAAARFGAAVALREVGGEVEVVIGAPGWPAAGSSGKGGIFTYRLEKRLPVVDVSLKTRVVSLSVNINNPAEFPFELTNGSAANIARNVVVRCVAPPGQVATLDWKKETAKGNLPELVIPILAPGTTEQLICRIYPSTVGEFSLRVYATVGHDEDDPNSSDNEVAVTFKVELPKIDLALEKTGVNSPAYIRRDASVLFSLRNLNQKNAAHDFVVNCTAPGASALRLMGPTDRITINGAQGVVQALAPGASLDLTCINTEATAGVVDVVVQVTAGSEENDTDLSNNHFAQPLKTVAPGQLALTMQSEKPTNIDKGSQARIEFMLEGKAFHSGSNPYVMINGLTDSNASVLLDPSSGTKGSVLLETSNLPRGVHTVQLVWDVADAAGDPQTLRASKELNVRRAVAAFSGTPKTTFDFRSYIMLSIDLDASQGAGRFDQVHWALRHADATQTRLTGVASSGHVEISSELEVGEYELALFFEGEENPPDATLRIQIRELGPPTQGPHSAPIPEPTPSSGAIDWSVMVILIIGIAHGRRVRVKRRAGGTFTRAIQPRTRQPAGLCSAFRISVAFVLPNILP